MSSKNECQTLRIFSIAEGNFGCMVAWEMLKVGLTFFALSWGPKARSTWLGKLPLAYIVSEAWTGHLHAMLVLWTMQHLAMILTTPLAMT